MIFACRLICPFAQSFVETLTVVLPYYPTGTMERITKEGQVMSRSAPEKPIIFCHRLVKSCLVVKPSRQPDAHFARSVRHMPTVISILVPSDKNRPHCVLCR